MSRCLFPRLSAGVLSLCLFVPNFSAQAGEQTLTVYGGLTLFNRPEFDTLAVVEFPFSLNRQELEFFKPDTSAAGYFARVFAQITLYGIDGLPVDSANTYFSVAVPSMTEAARPGYKVFNSLVLPAPPGVYSARLKLIDAVSKNEGDAFYARVVVEPPRRTLAIGGKCLAYDITYVGDTAFVPVNKMPKNGFDVLCNPLGVFSTEDTAIFLYAELYNLAEAPGEAADYQLEYAALDPYGTVVQSLGAKHRPRPGPSAVIAERFDISGLPEGPYQLRIVASDPVSGQTDTQTIALALVSPSAGTLMAADSEQLEFDPYDTLSLQAKENLVYYLLNPEEKKDFKRLDPAGREIYLGRYWQQSDEDPLTTIIENRLEVIRRYEYCNHYFSTNESGTDGWFTDRGRIYMKYGPWDDLDDIQQPLEGNPYQVWRYYEVREGAVFVFEDLQGDEVYTLVHSNVEGEIYNSDWNERLKYDYYKQD